MPEKEMAQETLDADSPRLERWLVVMLLAIVPMLVALAVDRQFVLHFAMVSGILFTAGVAMFIAHERRRR
jgi:uncharacterized membrane-anchored protein